MIAFLDTWIDRVTMYRLVLYYLIAILLVATGLAFFGLLPYPPLAIVGSVVFLIAVCYAANHLFSYVFEAPGNLESLYITALILACILAPLQTYHDLPLLFWGGVLAVSSKYIMAIRRKHVFNPVAIAVVLTGLWLNQPATWWIGTPNLFPVVLILGLVMVRKLRRYNQVYYFVLAAFLTSTFFTALAGHDVFNAANQLMFKSSLFFFAFVMLTEPLTSPASPWLQGVFGGLVGILFAPQVHFGGLYFTPELALVTGNVFAYLVSPKIKERLELIASRRVSSDVVEFEFKPSRPFKYRPGQYMEFTLPHDHPDSRGFRRYLTLSSSPTEKTVKLGVKFYPSPSSLKNHLIELKPGEALMAGQLAGEFTLPRDQKQKLAFIAGGIGITPFRSMLKYVADMGERRNIAMLYMNKTADEIAYGDVFNEARLRAGTRTEYVLTEQTPAGWNGLSGRINEAMVRARIPDYLERHFYISGPHPMVAGTESLLQSMGVPNSQIKKDFFPGLA